MKWILFSWVIKAISAVTLWLIYGWYFTPLGLPEVGFMPFFAGVAALSLVRGVCFGDHREYLDMYNNLDAYPDGYMFWYGSVLLSISLINLGVFGVLYQIFGG